MLDAEASITGVGVRALGYGTTAANSVDVDAGSSVTLANDGDATGQTLASDVNVDFTALDGEVFDALDYPQVNASYGLPSNQSSSVNVTSSITADATPFTIAMGNEGTESGNVVSSSVDNDGNSLSASAFGNQSTSDMQLDLGGMGLAAFDEGGDDSTYAPVANVTNVQSLGRHQHHRGHRRDRGRGLRGRGGQERHGFRHPRSPAISCRHRPSGTAPLTAAMAMRSGTGWK
ncbi:MAG: hypothetical protein U5L11_00760 [Arhodomonas sp.]|nr:hypothetical protein [Arhodomonas sp.]